VPELPICTRCGAQFIAPVKFCELCGTPVAPLEPIQDADDEVIIAPEPVPEPEEPVRKPDQFTAPKISGLPKRPEKKQVEEPEPDLADFVKKPASVSVPRDLGIPKTPEKKYMGEPGPAPVRTPPPAKPARAITPDPLSAEFSGLSDEPVRSAPAKRSYKKALIGGAIILLLILIIAAGAYFIGLPMIRGGSLKTAVATTPATTMPTEIPTVTEEPVITTVPTPVPTTAGPSLVPGPVQTLPANQAMIFQVDKDPVNEKVTVMFAGGPGITSLSVAEVRLTLPDGQVLTDFIRPSQGISEVTLQGSKETDRVEVIAKIYSGQKYTVIDQLVFAHSR
jgi:hypothetical protein